METTGRNRRRIIVSTLAVLALLAASGAGWILWRQQVYNGNIQRIPNALPPASSTRPLPDPGENWLLVGSDMRGEFTTRKWREGEARSDTIMVLHAPEDEERSYIISIPRDSWVDIPGHGKDKINAAFENGGPRLLTETVEDISGIRIDHFAAVDFSGFKQITDALGGVEVNLTEDVTDPSNGWEWNAGPNHMDGAEALRFVRERKGLPGADVDRVKRQQAFMKAMAEKATDSGLMTDPGRLDRLLRAATGALAVDSGTDSAMLRSLALRLARGGPDKVDFASLPVASTAWEGEKNVAVLNESVLDGLDEAMREGRISGYIADHAMENDIDEVN